MSGQLFDEHFRDAFATTSCCLDTALKMGQLFHLGGDFFCYRYRLA